MTTELMPVSGNGRATSLLPDGGSWATMWEMAKAFHQSGLLPRAVTTPAAALLIIQTGQELGIPPTQALRSVHVIEGKPTLAAELMLALIKSRVGPDAMTVEETTALRCTVSYARPGWEKRRSLTWTMEQATKAGVTNKSVWRQYPEAMLRARCISAACRMEFPDIVGGFYCAEELDAPVQMMPGGTVEIVQEAAPIPVQVDTETGEIGEPEPGQNADPDRAMKRVHAVGREKGLDHDAIKTLAVGMMAERGAELASLKDLGEKGLDGLANYLDRTDSQTLQGRVKVYREHGAKPPMQASDAPRPMTSERASRDGSWVAANGADKTYNRETEADAKDVEEAPKPAPKSKGKSAKTEAGSLKDVRQGAICTECKSAPVDAMQYDLSVEAYGRPVCGPCGMALAKSARDAKDPRGKVGAEQDPFVDAPEPALV